MNMLTEQLGDIELEIEALIAKRNEILSKISRLEKLEQMRRIGELFGEIVSRGSRLENSVHACSYANISMLPWRHRLPYMFFEHTLEVLMPNGGPSSFTGDERKKFFASVSAALQKDMAAIESA